MIVKHNPFKYHSSDRDHYIFEISASDVIQEEMDGYDPDDEWITENMITEEDYEKWLEGGGAEDSFELYEDLFLDKTTIACVKIAKKSSKFNNLWVVVDVVDRMLYHVAHINDISEVKPYDNGDYRWLVESIIPRLDNGVFYSAYFTEDKNGLLLRLSEPNFSRNVIIAPLSNIASILGDEVLLTENGYLNQMVTERLVTDGFEYYLNNNYFDDRKRNYHGLIDAKVVLTCDDDNYCDRLRRTEMDTFFRMMLNEIFTYSIDSYNFDAFKIAGDMKVVEAIEDTYLGFIKQQQRHLDI